MPSNDSINHLDNKQANHEASTLETMDTALFNYVNESLDPFCTTNKGWRKVPVRWSSAERARMSKDQKQFSDGVQDPQRTLILPLITIERTTVTKDLSRKGPYWANVPSPDGFGRGNVLTVARRINQDKTGNHQNAYRLRDRKQLNFKIAKRDDRIVWRYERVPQPIYLDVAYQIKIKTEYQQQINEIAQVFMRVGEGINYDTTTYLGHKYELFVDADFSQDNNISDLGEDERKYETTVTIKMLGMLLGLGENQAFPQVQYVESAVEYKQPREYVVFQDDEGNFINPYDTPTSSGSGEPEGPPSDPELPGGGGPGGDGGGVLPPGFP